MKRFVFEYVIAGYDIPSFYDVSADSSDTACFLFKEYMKSHFDHIPYSARLFMEVTNNENRSINHQDGKIFLYSEE